MARRRSVTRLARPFPSMGVAFAAVIGCLACSGPSDPSPVEDASRDKPVETTAVDAPAAPPAVEFAREEIEPAPVGADVKAVGDVDGDGDVDVVAGDDSGFALTWYENPTWRARVIDDRSVFTTDMELGDVDADGDLDVIVPDYAAGTMVWHANPDAPDGTWTMHTIGDAGAHDVQVGDQEGDGDLDVVVRGHNGPTVLFVQRAPTSWARRELPAPDGEGLGYGDLDGDGDLDVAQNGWWLEAPSDPGSDAWARHDFAGGWPSLVAAEVVDVDGDGRNDIVLSASESSGRMAWYRAPAEPRTDEWSETVVADDLDYVHQFVADDVDRDGDRDIFFAEMAQSSRRRVGWMANDGAGTAWTMHVIATSGSHNIRGADIDGDGDVDIVGGNYDPAPIELWRNLLQ